MRPARKSTVSVIFQMQSSTLERTSVGRFSSSEWSVSSTTGMVLLRWRMPSSNSAAVACSPGSSHCISQSMITVPRSARDAKIFIASSYRRDMRTEQPLFSTSCFFRSRSLQPSSVAASNSPETINTGHSCLSMGIGALLTITAASRGCAQQGMPAHDEAVLCRLNAYLSVCLLSLKV